jgi:phospholipid transport system transporter-binding protein
MLQLPATLTHSTASACLADLLQVGCAEPAPCVTLDASALVQFDSTALAVLLELRRTLSSLGKTLSLQGVPPRLQDLASVYGIAGLLPVNT